MEKDAGSLDKPDRKARRKRVAEPVGDRSIRIKTESIENYVPKSIVNLLTVLLIIVIV